MAKNSLLAQEKAQYKKRIKVDEKKTKSIIPNNAFDCYKAFLRDRRVYDFKPDRADKDGNLFLTDENGIQLVLPGEVFKKTFVYYNPKNPKIRESFVGGEKTIKTIVSRIDEENGIVELAGDPRFLSIALTKEIQKELKKKESGDEYELSNFSGTVTKVSQFGVNIDILDNNIRGFIERVDWARYPIRRLEDVCRVGDIIQFDIIGICPQKQGKPIQFKCDHSKYAEDPWETVPIIEKDSIILVTCTEKPQGKTYWWGISNSLPNIEIQCDYSSSFEVALNGVYKSFVREIDRDKHVCRVTPFESVEARLSSYDRKPDDNTTETNVTASRGKINEALTLIEVRDLLGLSPDTPLNNSKTITDSNKNDVLSFSIDFDLFFGQEIADYTVGLVNYYNPNQDVFIRYDYWNRKYGECKTPQNQAIFERDKGKLINKTDGAINTSKNLYIVLFKKNEEATSLKTNYLILAKKIISSRIVGVHINNDDKNIEYTFLKAGAVENPDLTNQAQNFGFSTSVNIEATLNNVFLHNGKYEEGLSYIEEYKEKLSEEKYYKLRYAVLPNLYKKSGNEQYLNELIECIDKLLLYTGKNTNKLGLIYSKGNYLAKGGRRADAISVFQSWIRLFEESKKNLDIEKGDYTKHLEKIKEYINSDTISEFASTDIGITSNDEIEDSIPDSYLDDYVLERLERTKCEVLGESFSVFDDVDKLSEDEVIRLKDLLDSIPKAKTIKEYWAIAKVYSIVQELPTEIVEERRAMQLMHEALLEAFYLDAHHNIASELSSDRLRASASFFCTQALALKEEIKSIIVLIGSTCLSGEEFNNALKSVYSLQDIVDISIKRNKVSQVIKALTISFYKNPNYIEGFVDEFSKCNEDAISVYINEFKSISEIDSLIIRDQLEAVIDRYKNVYLSFKQLTWNDSISSSAESYRAFLNDDSVIGWIKDEVISLADLREFFRALTDYDVVKGFDLKAKRLQKALEIVYKWTDDIIIYHPTINLFDLFRPCFYSFTEKALSTYRHLCKTTRPMLIIGDNIEVEKGGVYSFVLSVNASYNNVQSAKDVYVRIKENELFECDHRMLVAKEIPADGRHVPVSVMFKPTGELPPIFSVEVGLEYKYISDVVINEKRQERHKNAGVLKNQEKKYKRVFIGQEIEKTRFWPGSSQSQWMSVDISIVQNENKHPLSLERVKKFVEDGNIAVKDIELRKILKNRSDIINEIIDAITISSNNGIKQLNHKGRWVIIYGQWRVGKSVILNCVKDVLSDCNNYPDTLVLKIDCKGGSDQVEFERFFAALIFRELQSKMRRSPYLSIFNDITDFYGIPKTDVEKEGIDWGLLCLFMSEFLKDIREVDSNASIVLIIDEFTEIYQAIIKGHAGEGFPARWTDLVSKSDLLCITAGGEHTVSLMDAYTPNTLQKAAKNLYVDYLTPDDVDEYVHYVFGESSDDCIPVEQSYFSSTSGAAVSRIYALTRGNSYLLKVFCEWLIEFMIEKKKSFLSITVVNDTLEYIMKKQGMDVDSMETTYFNSLYNPFNESNSGENYVSGVKRLQDDIVKEDNQKILHQIVRISNRETHSCVYEELRDSLTQSMSEEIFNKRFNTLIARKIINLDSNKNVSIYIDLYFEIVSRLIGGYTNDN